MFYEEKCIDGVWYARTSPTGKWESFTPGQCWHKIAALTARVAEQRKLVCDGYGRYLRGEIEPVALLKEIVNALADAGKQHDPP